MEVRGGWKWHRELWMLRNHFTSKDICFLCKATTKAGPNQFLGTNVEPQLQLRYSKFDRMEEFERYGAGGFFLHALGNYVNPICACIGFSPMMVRFCSA